MASTCIDVKLTFRKSLCVESQQPHTTMRASFLLAAFVAAALAGLEVSCRSLGGPL